MENDAKNKPPQDKVCVPARAQPPSALILAGMAYPAFALPFVVGPFARTMGGGAVLARVLLLFAHELHG